LLSFPLGPSPHGDNDTPYPLSYSFFSLYRRYMLAYMYTQIGPKSYPSHQGDTKRCRLSWLTTSALVYEPKCGGGRGCGTSANEYSCVHGAQINFGDLTPYLTYAPHVPFMSYIPTCTKRVTKNYFCESFCHVST
jgi:hypothetical protein